jgi:hypothetical protein
MMNSLTLDKAMELYEILGAHVPEVEDDTLAWDFIGKIIDNVSDSDPVAYTKAIEIMTDKTLQELQELGSENRLELFSMGLSHNRILDFKSFCDMLGFSYA